LNHIHDPIIKDGLGFQTLEERSPESVKEVAERNPPRIRQTL